MRMSDIRWQQRFQNFERAYSLLKTAFEDRELDSFSDLEKEGLIQRFEYSFELGWNVLKDVLEYNGISRERLSGPRPVIKEAFSFGLIEDGQVWIAMMLHRNQLSHMYDSTVSEVVLEAIRDRYVSEFGVLHKSLAAKLEEEK